LNMIFNFLQSFNIIFSWIPCTLIFIWKKS
jgi:hypothetical protein